MRDVIQGVIEAEGEARRIVEAAHQEEERLIGAAQAQAQATLARAREEIRVQAETIIQSDVQQAQVEKKRRLEKAEFEIRGTMQLDAPTRDQIVDAVVQCVYGSD